MTTTNSDVKIGGYSIGHLLSQAQKVVEKKALETPIFDTTAEERIPRFDADELTVGRVLGRGGFCTVSEVTKVALMDGNAARSSMNSHGNNDDNEEDERTYGVIIQDRDFMETHFLRNGKEYRYAIKKLKEDSTKDVHTFMNGIVDLALEARFLAVIRHPNVIKMRAVASTSPYSRDFFIVLDRLYDILSHTLVSWKKRKGAGLSKLFDRGGKKSTAFWVERITVAHDLAGALRYLHRINIVYRDLKPDNIGFDVRGDVKIFDFGLSRQLPTSSGGNDGTFKMTGDTGSPRYMAPEIARELPYNQSSDVYSFGILLHQICSLDVPFDGFTMSMFQTKVVNGGYRPKLDPKWPSRIQTLLKRCWSSDISERPKMEEILRILSEEIGEKSSYQGEDSMDASGKTQHSLHAFQSKKGKS